jgi:hypothetical protein
MSTDLLSDVGAAKGAATEEGTQWGLASLVIGGGLCLAAPITLVANILLWRAGPSGLPVGLALAAAVVGLLVVAGLAASGIAFGLRGWRATAGGGRPSPLATAGVLTGAAASVIWLIVGIDLIAILVSFAS